MPLTEVAPRVWVQHDPSAPELPNTVVVGGDRGLLVVDPSGPEEAGPAGMVAGLRALGHGEVLAVVTTHGHAAHARGHAAHPGVAVHAHEAAAAELLAVGGLSAVEAFSSARALDLGGRTVELVHPGRGHTAGDLVLRVPDADVLATGDLVVQGGPPRMGEDCFPLEWPATLDLVLGLITPATLVVPGHGTVVDREFVEAQRDVVGTVAQTIHDLAARGVPVTAALDTGEWPCPREALEHAVARGYAQLPRAARQLPLA